MNSARPFVSASIGRNTSRQQPGAICPVSSNATRFAYLPRCLSAKGKARAVSLVSGALESSNVNVVDGLVEMIGLARRFELQIQMMQAASENEALAAELLELG